MVRNVGPGVSLPAVSGAILGMAGSAETARLKAGSTAHSKVVQHVLAKKPAGPGMKAGVPPPLPPNKPAIYKPMKADAVGVADVASKK
jgi:hypothetical protein